MRIAMVGPFGLHPNQTMRSRALSLARPLQQRGHQVRLLMPPWQTPQEAGRQWQEDGVELRYTPLRGGLPGIAWQLLRETVAWRPDVVHCFKPKAYSGLVMWWLWHFRRRRLRLALDTDDWEGWGGWNELAPYTALQKRFFAWQERWGLRHCHVLTVASRTLQSLAWSQGVPPERVVYLPNGPGIGERVEALDDSRLLALANRPTLLLYSRLFEFDVQRLVVILQGVQAAVPDLAVLAVGAGLYEEDSARLKKALATAGLEAMLVDVGWVEPGELPLLFALADVGIYLMEDTLLNRTKCPVKLADMLSQGLPVVAEAVGQVMEYVVPGQNGKLRPSGDVAGLTADLIRLLQDEGERGQLAAGARAHIANHFNWQALSEKLELAYTGQAA
jgi:glycosyltransferase involved in cell wall biosynthesis